MTILVYKDGRWLIDNEQPLEGVSLDNLAAILSNPKDGDVVKYDEASGMWIAGGALPPVTPSDNGKVLAVENGAWAAQGDITINGTLINGVITLSNAPQFAVFENAYNMGRGVILNLNNGDFVCRLVPYIHNYLANNNDAYTFCGSGVDFDLSKYLVYLVADADSGVAANIEPLGGKFIVTLTPTALDYSGTMDKTVAEINAAYEAGQEIWLKIEVEGMGYLMERASLGNGSPAATYPSFNAYFVNASVNVILYVYTGYTNGGTDHNYATEVYSLTPAS